MSKISKPITNGLEINKICLPVDNKTAGFFNLGMLFKILIAVSMMIGTVSHFITAYALPVNWERVILISVSAVVIECLALNSKKWGKALFWLGLTGILIVFLFLWQPLEDGFRVVADCVYVRINNVDIGIFNGHLIENPLEKLEFFIEIFIVFLSLFISFSIMGKTNIFLLLLATFPIAELSLYYAIEPAHWAVALELSGWIGALSISLAHRYDYSKRKFTRFSRYPQNLQFNTVNTNNVQRSGQVGGVVALLTAFTFIVSGIIYKHSGWTRSADVDELRVQIATRVMPGKVNNRTSVPDSIAYPQAVSERQSTVKLRSQRDVEFENKPILRVTMQPTANPIYLRGFASGYYSDGSWNPLKEGAYAEYPNLFNSSGQMITMGISLQSLPFKLFELVSIDYFDGRLYSKRSEMHVENLANYDQRFYHPYLTDYPMNNNYLALDWDANGFWRPNLFPTSNNVNNSYLIKRSGATTYNYFPPLSLDEVWMTLRQMPRPISLGILNAIGSEDGDILAKQLNTFSQLQLEYENFVYKNYLDLPANALERLKDEWGSLSHLSAKDVTERILHEFYNGGYTYTLSPPATPDDTDFIDYFLYESKVGYCTYFASAATLMFRAAGIPARYVEGYSIAPEDFTSQNRNQDDLYQIDIPDNRSHAWTEIYCGWLGWQPVDVTPGGTGGNADYVDPISIDTTANNNATVNNVTTPPPVTTVSNPLPKNNLQEDKEPLNPYLLTLLVFLSVILLIIISLGLIRISVILRLNKRFNNPNVRQALFSIYSYHVKLLKGTLAIHTPPDPGDYEWYTRVVSMTFPDLKQEEILTFLRGVEAATFYSVEKTQDLEFARQCGIKVVRTIRPLRLKRLNDYRRFKFMYIYRL